MNNLVILKQYTNLVLQLESTYKKKAIPTLEVGDSLKLGVLIKEGNKERIQFYEGILLAMKNRGLNKTITVRRVLQGIGVERIFLIHSPKLVSMEVLKSARVRRSKLYYLRNLAGKASRLKQSFKKKECI